MASDTMVQRSSRPPPALPDAKKFWNVEESWRSSRCMDIVAPESETVV